MGKKFRSDNVEKYYLLVYHLVNKDPRVHTQDKLDVSHDAVAKIASYQKDINFTYIGQTVNSIIHNYVSRNMTRNTTRKDIKEYFYPEYDKQDFTDFDFENLPIDDKLKEEAINLLLCKGKDRAEEEGVHPTAIYKRKSRLIEKIKNKLKQKDPNQTND